MVAVFAPVYEGLKPKGSYETVLAAVGKSEVGEPDRRAKLFRETPQISNLLDGEGALGMEALQKQELGAAKHRVVEATIREEAAEPSAPPAQQLRAEATTQTLMKSTNATGSQAQPSTSSTSSQAKPSAADAENQAQPSTGDAGSQAKPVSASSESQTQATQFFELTPGRNFSTLARIPILKGLLMSSLHLSTSKMPEKTYLSCD